MPPTGAKSPKRERQYEHIKESARKQGRSPARAKQIAAATVNKQRSEAGETKGSRKRTTKTAKKGGAARKTSAKKGSAKKGSAKKGSAKKGSARKTSARKTSAKKGSARKTGAKKRSS